MGLIWMPEDERRPAFNWAGIPFEDRYSKNLTGPKALVKKMREIDPLLDLKFYQPTLEWHVVRFPYGFSNGKFTRVWACTDDPSRGLRRELGYWIIDALKAGDTYNYAENRVDEIDEHNAKIDASNEKSLEDASECFAKEIRKPLQRFYDEGPQATHKGVF